MTDVMVAAFRHDAHKFTGESHDDAREMLASIPVNQPVPHGADGDAAALSRPQQAQKQTVQTHDNHYRLSLLTGETIYEPDEFPQTTIESAVADLLGVEDGAIAHERWLESNVAAGFNESIYHPYTSLKYHTLLVAALLDNYRAGHEFAELLLVVDGPEEIVPHRTVYAGSRFALRIDVDADGNPWACLGSHPWRSWASAWKRLTAHPLDVDHDKHDMVLDANLRRIRSWSIALQYIKDFENQRENV